MKLIFFILILIIGVPKSPIVCLVEDYGNEILHPLPISSMFKGLISLLQQASSSRLVEGVKICRDAPMINHLLFEDDNIILCKAEVESNKELQRLLQKYAQPLGQGRDYGLVGYN